ncbi:MAG: hypothetical protein LBC80_05725, partial [Treponema sp.]|nr:hypothetical protein [Treponema sp.]
MKLILFVIFLLFSAFVFGEETTELNIDEIRQRITEEAPNELMALSLLDSEVSLFLTGSWMGSFQFNPGFTVSPIGSGFRTSQTPLFSQEVDLTLSLWINDRWFVETNFLDDSNQNTYSAGYKGRPGEFIQFAVIGNTGLDFPSFPYMDLGGDSPASFGFYSRLGNALWDIHALFRYDSSSREERTFYGGRERNFFFEQPHNTIRGVSFVLPDYDIDSQITVYIEDERGIITDNSKRRWRIASPSEFAASSADGLLELSIRPAGMVAVSYSKSASQPWLSSMGSYDSIDNSGFLYTVQHWFDTDRQVIKLENYPQCGDRFPFAKRPGEVFFGSTAALVIYEPGTFSPFERRNRYETPSSDSQEAELIRLSTGNELTGFELVQLDSGFSSADLLAVLPVVSQRGIYELLISENFSSESISRRSPQTMWPLAIISPEIYIYPSYISGDITLRFTNFNSASGYFIGTDVVPGSVQVWRSGIQYTNFSYNVSSGEVTILGSVGQNELIRITYLKRSEETRLGSIAAGIGAIYSSNGPFSALAAIGVRMNISGDSFSDQEHSGEGSVGMSAKASWDYDNLKMQITGGMFFEQVDSTGLYRIAGMEGNEVILPLPPDTSFISNPLSTNLHLDLDLNMTNRVDLIFRNYINHTVLGSNLMPVEWNAPPVTGINRPYPARDTKLADTQVLVAEFDFSQGPGWTGFQVPVNHFSQNLSQASEIVIPFRFYGFNKNPAGNFKLIVQIGSLSGSDFAFSENPQLIWEEVLFCSDSGLYEPFNEDVRIPHITLNDEDRRKLADVRFLRIIAIYDGNEEITGRILLAKPIIRGAAFRPITFDGESVRGSNRVNATETVDRLPALSSTYPEIIRRLHVLPDKQRVLEISWENMEEEEISAGVDVMLNNIPLMDYRELSFFVKTDEQLGDKNETLSFIIANGAGGIDNSILKVDIPINSLKARAGQWSKITVRYQGENKGVFLVVGDERFVLPDAVFYPQSIQGNLYDNYYSYIAILVKPDKTQILDKGNIYIDEIILEDPIVFYRINAGAALNYSKPGVLFSAGRAAVLSDFSVFSAFESEVRSSLDSNEHELLGSMTGHTGVEFFVFNTKISANIYSTITRDTFLWNAEHDILRAVGSFSLRDRFSVSPEENKIRHIFNAAYSSNFHAKFDADALYDTHRLRQNWVIGFGYNPNNINIPSFSINTQANWIKNEQLEDFNAYGKLWLESWIPLIPDAGLDASSRRTKSQIVLTQRTRPVGVTVTLEGNTFFSKVNDITQSESSAFLDIPVVLSVTNIQFRMGREFKRHILFSGNDVFDDTKKLLETIEDSLVLWEVLPFYSLFSDNLKYS